MKYLITVFSLMFTATTFAHESEPVEVRTFSGNGDLIIRTGNYGSDDGQAMLTFFRETDDVMKKPFLRLFAPIENGSAEFTIPDQPFGYYAIILIHDENNNGKPDHNMLKFPSEPMGFSGSYKMSLFSGKPSFKKLQFVFDDERQEIQVDID